MTGTFALTSNPEWMTMARNIEGVGLNWTNGVVVSGCLKIGNTGGAAPCLGGASSYDGPNPDSGIGRLDLGTAKLEFSNGQQVWDLAGNVSEWVDWDITSTLLTITPANKAYVSGDGAPVALEREFLNLDTNISSTDEMPTDSWQPQNIALLGTDGTGRYFAGTNAAGGAARRGGDFSDLQLSGIYSLKTNEDSTYADANTGFRCVYRPVQ